MDAEVRMRAKKNARNKKYKDKCEARQSFENEYGVPRGVLSLRNFNKCEWHAVTWEENGVTYHTCDMGGKCTYPCNGDC